MPRPDSVPSSHADMSVVGESDIEYRAFGGYADRRLPTALWRGQVTLVGDASGGTRLAQLVFNQPTAVVLSRHFSLEGLYLTDGDNVSKVARLLVSNFDEINGQGKLMQINLQLEASISSAQLGAQSTLAVRGLYLGQQAQVLTLTTVQVQVTNVDTAGLTLEGEGYVWGPEAASAPDGGLQRPGGGLYLR